MIGGTRQAFLRKTMDSPILPEIEGRQRARVLSEILCGEWQSGEEADSHIHSQIKATQLGGYTLVNFQRFCPTLPRILSIYTLLLITSSFVFNIVLVWTMNYILIIGNTFSSPSGNSKMAILDQPY